MALSEHVNGETELRDMKWRGIVNELQERIDCLNDTLNLETNELNGNKWN